MPSPGKNETQQDFVSRCMAYPDMQKYGEKQRAAICFSKFRNKAIGEAADHLDAAASMHERGDLDEQEQKRLMAGHRYHAKMLKELLRDTEGQDVHGPL